MTSYWLLLDNNIDRDRHQFVRGLSKVYELRDGAESIKIDKDNLLNESSLPENGSSKHHLSTSIRYYTVYSRLVLYCIP